MLALFCTIWGLFTASQANQFGPDVGKAGKACIKIFKIIDTPTDINAIEVSEKAIKIEEGKPL